MATSVFSPEVSYDHQSRWRDVSDFFDEAGRIPWVSVLSGAVRGVVGVIACAVSLVAWPVFWGLGEPTVVAKDGVAFGAQHVLMGIAEILQSKLYLYKELKNFSIGLVSSEGVRPEQSEWRWSVHTWKLTLGQKIRQVID